MGGRVANLSRSRGHGKKILIYTPHSYKPGHAPDHNWGQGALAPQFSAQICILHYYLHIVAKEGTITDHLLIFPKGLK